MRLSFNAKDWTLRFHKKLYNNQKNDIWPDGSGSAMSNRDKAVCEYLFAIDEIWNPITISKLMDTWNSSHHLDFSKSLYSQSDRIPSSILLDYKLSVSIQINELSLKFDCLLLNTTLGGMADTPNLEYRWLSNIQSTPVQIT